MGAHASACDSLTSVSALFVRSLVVGSCRQNLSAVDVTCPFANANEDAFEIDQTDRDLARVLLVPPAHADGYKLNSNGNSVDRGYHLGARERGVGQLRRALKPGSRCVNAVRLTASKIFAQPNHCLILNCGAFCRADCPTRRANAV